MKIIKLLLPIFLLACLFPSCRNIHGSGNLVTESRNLSNFEAVDVGGIAEVTYVPGDSYLVEVTADDNIIERVETKLKGQTLHIGMKSVANYSDVTVRVKISAPRLSKVDCSGASSFSNQGVWRSTERLVAEGSGASNLELVLDAPQVKLHTSGAASIKASGQTRSTDLGASGSGSISAFDLLSENMKAEASGAGTVKGHASVQLDAHASGAGSVRYRGTPSVKSSTSGAGSVAKQ